MLPKESIRRERLLAKGRKSPHHIWCADELTDIGVAYLADLNDARVSELCNTWLGQLTVALEEKDALLPIRETVQRACLRLNAIDWPCCWEGAAVWRTPHSAGRAVGQTPGMVYSATVRFGSPPFSLPCRGASDDVNGKRVGTDGAIVKASVFCESISPRYDESAAADDVRLSWTRRPSDDASTSRSIRQTTSSKFRESLSWPAAGSESGRLHARASWQR